MKWHGQSTVGPLLHVRTVWDLHFNTKQSVTGGFNSGGLVA